MGRTTHLVLWALVEMGNEWGMGPEFEWVPCSFSCGRHVLLKLHDYILFLKTKSCNIILDS